MKDMMIMLSVIIAILGLSLATDNLGPKSSLILTPDGWRSSANVSNSTLIIGQNGSKLIGFNASSRSVSGQKCPLQLQQQQQHQQQQLSSNISINNPIKQDGMIGFDRIPVVDLNGTIRILSDDIIPVSTITGDIIFTTEKALEPVPNNTDPVPLLNGNMSNVSFSASTTNMTISNPSNGQNSIPYGSYSAANLTNNNTNSNDTNRRNPTARNGSSFPGYDRSGPGSAGLPATPLPDRQDPFGSGSVPFPDRQGPVSPGSAPIPNRMGPAYPGSGPLPNRVGPSVGGLSNPPGSTPPLLNPKGQVSPGSGLSPLPDRQGSGDRRSSSPLMTNNNGVNRPVSADNDEDMKTIGDIILNQVLNPLLSSSPSSLTSLDLEQAIQDPNSLTEPVMIRPRIGPAPGDMILIPIESSNPVFEADLIIELDEDPINGSESGSTIPLSSTSSAVSSRPRRQSNPSLLQNRPESNDKIQPGADLSLPIVVGTSTTGPNSKTPLTSTGNRMSPSWRNQIVSGSPSSSEPMMPSRSNPSPVINEPRLSSALTVNDYLPVGVASPEQLKLQDQQQISLSPSFTANLPVEEMVMIPDDPVIMFSGRPDLEPTEQEDCSL